MITPIIKRFVVLGLGLVAGLSLVYGENSVAVGEVLKLQDAGVAEGTLVAYIQSKSINYDLSADNIIALKDKGLSVAVLNAMVASGRGSVGPVNAPPPAPALAAPAAPAQLQPAPTALTASPMPQTAPVGASAMPTGFSADAASFYQELSPYGRWVFVPEDGQWYWQPTVAVSTPGWRPYWDQGHWVYTDHGWYWSSDYPWGWAPFHYGRWHLHPRYGWVWLPDRAWGPAWVVWRSGGDYSGWAPLPPGAVYDTAAACFLFRGRRVDAGFDFGLDWGHFNFCFTRELGDRFHRPFHPDREIFRHTGIVNNYTVVRHGAEVRVVNHGIEPGRVAAARGHPIETIRIQDARTPVTVHGQDRFDTRNRTLEVYRPKLGDHNRPEHGDDRGR